MFKNHFAEQIHSLHHSQLELSNFVLHPRIHCLLAWLPRLLNPLSPTLLIFLYHQQHHNPEPAAM